MISNDQQAFAREFWRMVKEQHRLDKGAGVWRALVAVYFRELSGLPLDVVVEGLSRVRSHLDRHEFLSPQDLARQISRDAGFQDADLSPLWVESDEPGQLRSPSTGRAWSVPEKVDMVGEKLVYSYAKPHRDYVAEQDPRHSREPLESFARLANVDDDSVFAQAVVEFAKRWGVLGICEHELPAGHNHACLGFPLAPMGCQPRKQEESDLGYWEPLDAWRQWSGRANAILQLSAELWRGRLGEEALWDVCGVTHFQSILEFWHSRGIGHVEYGRWQLAMAVSTWLDRSGARPILVWEQDGPKIVLTGMQSHALPAVLGVQLMLTVGMVSGLCAGCSKLLVRGKDRKFCKSCIRRGIPGAQRRARHRNLQMQNANRPRQQTRKLTQQQERAIESTLQASVGVYGLKAQLARKYGVTAARISQIAKAISEREKARNARKIERLKNSRNA